MIEPHGGTLVDLLARAEKRDALVERAGGLRGGRRSAPARPRTWSCWRWAGFSPLRGFQGADDWKRVVHEMRLADGLPWSIPITLATGVDAADGDELALNGPDGRLLGVLTVEETFERNLEEEARHVYRTTDTAHPGVAAPDGRGNPLRGGPCARRGPSASTRTSSGTTSCRRRLRAPPSRSGAGRRSSASRPATRSTARTSTSPRQRWSRSTGCFIHPLVGETKSDDIPADVRMRCYEVLLDNYYSPDHVLLAINPAAMRYAGPREAIFHALIRKNYGCTHFIVGRDHAGVGDYYGTYDAQEIFGEFDAAGARDRADDVRALLLLPQE